MCCACTLEEHHSRTIKRILAVKLIAQLIDEIPVHLTNVKKVQGTVKAQCVNHPYLQLYRKNCIQSIQCCISGRSKTAKIKCYKL